MSTPSVPHVALVGLMGAGKSDVGRRLAARLGRRFVDLDRAVVDRAAADGVATSVGGIFDVEGEAGFRRRETEELSVLVGRAEPLVIATGGGVVETPANAVLLAERCTVVWLRADVATLVARVGSGAGRPLLQGSESPEAVLTRLADRRHPSYERIATVVVPTDGRTAAEVLDAVLDALPPAVAA